MNNNAVAVLLADLRDSRLMRLHGDAYMPRITAAIAALQTPAASSAGAGDWRKILLRLLDLGQDVHQVAPALGGEMIEQVALLRLAIVRRLESPIAGGQASEGASRRCKECCGSPCECPSGLAEAHTLRAEIARRIETFRYAGPLINAEEDAKAAVLTKEWESLLAWADAQGERS